ncbi:MAG: LacI family transcriptional regulator [Zetaproteobacteria bacterium]|nr:MAG: LacI family transcriptional regulator [Zetaproteobacteria bacterium]
MARGLVQNRTATVGVVVLELSNPFFVPMLSAVETVAAKRGFLVVVGESGRDPDKERRYVEQFQQLRIGGIIVTTASRRFDHLAAARAGGTPVVLMARRWDEGDYVTADHVEAGRLVGKHLLARNYRRIGLVWTYEPENTAIEERVHGVREVLADAGLELPERWNLRTPTTLLEDGMDAADRYLAMTDRPRAVFVSTDRQAMGFVERLVSQGLRVPEDMAVVGYDDIPFAACARVPLTTVAIPMRRMGDLAAEILFDRLDGVAESESRQILLQPELIVRASSP